MMGKVLAFAGGVGGAKLALGLSRIIPPEQLVICVNTGDDECFHGLHVSPDLDTVMYTLAGLADPQSGWGIKGDTFDTLKMLRCYGADTWFNLGDRDLATHIWRTQQLRQGSTLSEVTANLCHSLGVAHDIVPMSDDPVRTVLKSDLGELAMQQYFVQHKTDPKISQIEYLGSDSAKPSQGIENALDQASLIVFCPSNPFLSLGPIFAISGVREKLENTSAIRLAVSPMIGGAAVKGPAAKIMYELGHEVSSVGVASQYQGICDIFMLDNLDAHLGPSIKQLGIKPVVGSILMDNDEAKVALARYVIQIASS